MQPYKSKKSILLCINIISTTLSFVVAIILRYKVLIKWLDGKYLFSTYFVFFVIVIFCYILYTVVKKDYRICEKSYLNILCDVAEEQTLLMILYVFLFYVSHNAQAISRMVILIFYVCNVIILFFMRFSYRIYCISKVNNVKFTEELNSVANKILGKKSTNKKTVITYGTFDLLHYGHINLLRRAKALGDYLIVAVSTDEFNEQKKHKKSFFSYEHRKILIESLKYVDKVIPEENWEQKRDDIKKYNADIFVMGDDWKGAFDFLKEEKVEVIYLPRTPNVSSMNIKKELHDYDGEIEND